MQAEENMQQKTKKE